MTVTSSAAIDIGGGGGGRRSDRLDSDRTSEDMSFIASPANIGASFVDVQNESSGSIDTATATLHELNYTFGMPPVTEESENMPQNYETVVELLPGEERAPINKLTEFPIEGGSLFVTNFRIVVILKDKEVEEALRFLVFPLQDIEQIDLAIPAFIHLSLKIGRMFTICFKTAEDAALVHKILYTAFQRLNRPISSIYTSRPQDWTSKNTDNPMQSLNAFAWKFSEAVDELDRDGKLPSWLLRADSVAQEITHIDFNRLGMSEHFQISSVNENFEVCPTYPEKIIVPKGITDDDIRKGAPYRSIGRFPAVIWRCRKTRAVLMRSSQPQVGILSWRNPTDEKIIEEAVKASRIEGEEKKQFIIMDARGYTSAFANRARSGGFENTEYYQQAKLEFLGLPNIHAVRGSFNNVRTMLHNLGPNEQLLTSLQTTGWLLNLSNLLVNAANCADHLSKGHSVLVHCSDGWDRTTQVTTLAKIMLDEYYRTVKGFEELIRRDWIAFGHKLYDRQLVAFGNWGTSDERSPVFLQFLEAVRHLQREQPTLFQFTHAYLIKLAKHAYSGLFGSFLFNSHKERREAMEKCKGTLVDIWRFIGPHNEEYVNQSFDEHYTGAVKPVNVSVINLRVWHEVFADEEEHYTQIFSPKEERPLSGCTTPMNTSTSTNLVKSKSSESINSLNVDGSAKESSQQHPTCSTTPSDNTNSLPMSTSFIQQSLYQPKVRGVAAIDRDGVIRFEDDEQAMLRKKNKLRAEEIRRKDEKIEELRRRAVLDTNKVSPGQRQSYSESDVETTGTLERVMSDVSMVDPVNELPHFKPNTTWEGESGHCAYCKKEFNKLSVYVEDRQHHCRNCGRVVCEDCSKNRFSVIEEGKSVQKRACDSCYDSMHETDLKLSRATSLSEMSSFDSFGPSSPPASSTSSSSLNMLASMSPTRPQPIPISCKSSSNSISSPRPSPGEFSRHSSTQAVKG
ncbi:Phosphatidylinositol-3,5-bisphosphate 3-phosphatase MTMR3 [Caenorhabditis elegans]|uniref:Isoform b of Phosphatidylinositol-3,5-bisphosphate 3-phosphatase MTMR3 n=1 Tax=Caenorhabditis elegans TaxID=6239 RepID=Q22712-2|nr:Myotubularin-related protein 3 [Caenorhabditis elegans]ABK59970.1 MTM3b [Caenorhabditis elegans]CAA88884.2 Myotubularin-related protein 3 [Caenorhabditis elegans]|eukprot:NP_497766.3 Myotubularin-related protein 3 [Caenorhabditis elegans]